MSNVASIMGAAAGERPAPWRVNLSNASYDNVSFSFTAQSSNSKGITFNSDGTKMYMCASGQRRVYQYTLTTPYDLTSISYDSISYYFSTIVNPVAVTFKPDGTKMYVTSFDDDRFYEFSLSTAWVVSTASQVFTLSFTAQDTNGGGLFFGQSGTRLYLIGKSTNTVFQYSLTTPYDLSTASYDSISYYTGGSSAQTLTDISLSPNGNKMYLLGSVYPTANYGIIEYDLATPWDISTATSAATNFTDALITSLLRSFRFDDTGLKMFVLVGTTVYQYTSG